LNQKLNYQKSGEFSGGNPDIEDRVQHESAKVEALQQ
jgi:hypothetical protein